MILGAVATHFVIQRNSEKRNRSDGNEPSTEPVSTPAAGPRTNLQRDPMTYQAPSRHVAPATETPVATASPSPSRSGPEPTA